MGRNIHMFVDGKKIGNINHNFIYDDEASSGRDICEGCLLVLHDYKYRVVKVEEIPDGFEAHLRLSKE